MTQLDSNSSDSVNNFLTKNDTTDLAQAKANLIASLNLISYDPPPAAGTIFQILLDPRGREIGPKASNLLLYIGNVTKVDTNGNSTTNSSNKVRYEILSQNAINQAKSSFDSLTNVQIDELMGKLDSRPLADISEGEVLYIKEEDPVVGFIRWKQFVVATNELSSDGTYGTITFFDDDTDHRVTTLHSHYLEEEKEMYSGVEEGVYKRRNILQKSIFINSEIEKIQNAKSIKELNIIEIDFYKNYGITRNISNHNRLTNKMKLHMELNNENLNSIIDYHVGSYGYLSDRLEEVESASGESADCVIS